MHIDDRFHLNITRETLGQMHLTVHSVNEWFCLPSLVMAFWLQTGAAHRRIIALSCFYNYFNKAFAFWLDLRQFTVNNQSVFAFETLICWTKERTLQVPCHGTLKGNTNKTVGHNDCERAGLADTTWSVETHKWSCVGLRRTHLNMSYLKRKFDRARPSAVSSLVFRINKLQPISRSENTL